MRYTRRNLSMCVYSLAIWYGRGLDGSTSLFSCWFMVSLFGWLVCYLFYHDFILSLTWSFLCRFSFRSLLIPFSGSGIILIFVQSAVRMRPPAPYRSLYFTFLLFPVCDSIRNLMPHAHHSFPAELPGHCLSRLWSIASGFTVSKLPNSNRTPANSKWG